MGLLCGTSRIYSFSVIFYVLPVAESNMDMTALTPSAPAYEPGRRPSRQGGT
jgi:hypothetical protein